MRVTTHAERLLRTALFALCGWAVTLFARNALACSVCISATEETREAYYGTTILLMLLPFLILATFGGWLYRLSRDSVPSPGPPHEPSQLPEVDA